MKIKDFMDLYVDSDSIRWGVLALLLILAIPFFGWLVWPSDPSFEPVPEPVYLAQDCTPEQCVQGSFVPLAPPSGSDGLVIARVFGTIYEESDNASVLGTCSDSSNHPKDTNATVTIYNPDTSVLVDQGGMDEVDIGRFNYSLSVPSNKGNYLVMLNCTAGSDFAVAYTEFQNPPWTGKIQDILSRITSLGAPADFEIDKLTSVSPIYPNETVIVEVTFSDENGTLITPDKINLTVLYPNRSLFFEKTKGDFGTFGSVWNYSEVLTSSPVTGTYYVHLKSDYGTKQAVKTVQFRIATGGPFSLRLTCPSTGVTGEDLDCVVDIIDEGEVAVESITTVWVDTNSNSLLDPGEPQFEFSKETDPQQKVVQAAPISIPAGHASGVFIVRAKTSYVNSAQPDSTASDTVTLSQTEGEAVGGGSSAATPTFLGIQGVEEPSQTTGFSLLDQIINFLRAYWPWILLIILLLIFLTPQGRSLIAFIIGRLVAFWSFIWTVGLLWWLLAVLVLVIVYFKYLRGTL